MHTPDVAGTCTHWMLCIQTPSAQATPAAAQACTEGEKLSIFPHLSSYALHFPAPLQLEIRNQRIDPHKVEPGDQVRRFTQG